MSDRQDQSLSESLTRLDELLSRLTSSPTLRPITARWKQDAGAVRFHLQPRAEGAPTLLAVIGGTGAGKSTLANRLLGVEASATSFRRTFTAGPIALVHAASDVPAGWLRLEHKIASVEELPARGDGEQLTLAPRSAFPSHTPHEAILEKVALVDAPDLDGDVPAHHAEADRVFRWADAVLFLVTPEKYQMTELLPYYRLAARYGIASLFVMNKCEEQAVVDDYREQIARRQGVESGPVVYAVPRDGSAYEPPKDSDLAALRQSITQCRAGGLEFEAGLKLRAADLVGRCVDQILAPMRQERTEADRITDLLRAMERPEPGLDVNPVTQELQRRLQQRSVLYLMGPQRILDRVRQAPGMLIKLPRTAWDWIMRGQLPPDTSGAGTNAPPSTPDYPALLAEQFSILQSRIDDILRDSPVAGRWIEASADYQSSRLSPATAASIAEEELSDLRKWLEQHWNAEPRDTRAVHSLLRYVPGGQKITKLAESAPYLLALAMIARHALFGTDLIVLGGYSIAAWLSERFSNEVAQHTKSANSRIADRFSRLVHEQIQTTCAWVNRQVSANAIVDQLESAIENAAAAAGMKR